MLRDANIEVFFTAHWSKAISKKAKGKRVSFWYGKIRRVNFIPPLKILESAWKRDLANAHSLVSQKAALAGYKWLGRGDKNAADGAAVEVMRVAY